MVQTTASAGGGGTVVTYEGASAWGRFNANGADQGTYNCSATVASNVFTVTFDTPMATENYAVVGNTSGTVGEVKIDTITTTGFRMVTFDSEGTPSAKAVSFAVHSSNAIAPQAGVGADAWVRTSDDNGVISVQASYNIANVVRDSEGKYTVTFTTPMPVDEYSVVVTPQQSNKVYAVVTKLSMTKNSFQVNVYSALDDDTPFDCGFAATVHASSTVTPTYTWTRDGTTLKTANESDDVVTGNYNPIDNSSKGCEIGAGAITAQRLPSEGTSTLFRGLKGNDVNFEVTADGSATFAGAVSAPNACTAWVNFVGANGALRGSFNVNGPITRLGTGRYQIVFATEMDNSDYCAQVSSNQLTTIIDDITTTSVDISVFDAGGSRVDTNIVCCTVYGGKN